MFASSRLSPPVVLLIAASILLLCTCTPASVEAKSKRRRARTKATGKVLILGSSSINGALGKHIESRLAKRGLRVHRRGKSSAGLARPDYFDWMQEVDNLPIDAQTRGAVIYLGTNDGQALRLRPSEAKRIKHRGKWLRWGNKHWAGIYQARVTALARKLCARGVWRVAFMTPVDTTDRALLEKLRQIRRMQYRGARRSRCAWAWSGRGDARRIRREKPATPSSQRLRYKDGFHMTRLGAQTAWQRVEDRIVKYLNKRLPRRLRKRGRARRTVASSSRKGRSSGIGRPSS